MRTYAKAITSGVITTLSTLAALTADNGISLNDGLAAAAAGAASFGAVYGISNKEEG